jgi:hypothetical protein
MPPPALTATDAHGTVWTFAPRHPGQPYVITDGRPGRPGLSYGEQRVLSPCPECDHPILPHPGAGRPRTYCTTACATFARNEAKRSAEQARDDAWRRLPEVEAELAALRSQAVPPDLVADALSEIGIDVHDLHPDDNPAAFALRELLASVRWQRTHTPTGETHE